MAHFLQIEHRELVNHHLESITEQFQRLSLEASAVSLDHDVPVDLVLKEVEKYQGVNLFAADKLLKGRFQQHTLDGFSSEHDDFRIAVELVKLKLLIGPIREAESILSDLEKKAQTFDTKYQVCMLKGDVNIVLGNLKDAEAYYTQAVSIAKDGNFSKDKQVESFFCIQSSVYSQGKNDQALENLTPLLDNPNLTPRISALLKRTLGNIYRSVANYHLAEKYLSEAVALAKEQNDAIHEKEWTGELGRVYRSSGLHHEAIKRQKQAYEAALMRGDIARLAASCGYIGFTMYSLPSPNHNEAITYLGTRLILAEEKLGDRASIRWCLNNIGKVYLSMNVVEPAILCFQRSLEDAKQMGSLLGEGTAVGNLGSALREAGKHQEAVECHKNYLENARKRIDIGGEAIMLYELAVDHLLMKDLETATDYALKGFTTLKSIRSRLTENDDQLKIGHFEKNQSKLYNLLQQLLVKQGQYECALLISELGRARALSDLVQAKLKVQSPFSKLLDALVASDASIDETAVRDAFSHLYALCSQVDSTLVVYSIVNEISEENKHSTWVFIWVASSNKSLHFATKQIAGSHSVRFQLNEDFFSSLRRDIGKGLFVNTYQMHQPPTLNQKLLLKPLYQTSVTKKSSENCTSVLSPQLKPTFLIQPPPAMQQVRTMYLILFSFHMVWCMMSHSQD